MKLKNKYYPQYAGRIVHFPGGSGAELKNLIRWIEEVLANKDSTGINTEQGQFALSDENRATIKLEINELKALEPKGPVCFTIDTNPAIYEGFDTGVKWNGWACPMFTKEVADKIMADCQTEGFLNVKYDSAKDTYTFADPEIQDGEEPDIFQGEEFEGHMLYPIGSHYWVWEIVNPDNIIELNGEKYPLYADAITIGLNEAMEQVITRVSIERSESGELVVDAGSGVIIADSNILQDYYCDTPANREKLAKIISEAKLG